MEQITAFKGEYKFLSNFSHSPFTAHVYVNPSGVHRFRTVEHFFQACKAFRVEDQLRIIKAATPRQAKTLGRNVELVDNWEDIKQDVMLLGLRYKFTQPSRRILLIATGDAELIEGNTWNDRYWGMVQLNGANGPTWQGENHLGRLLMHLRSELKRGG
jgi:ribA/ribD-fused uncharacterized protein